jgi:hypothetical protein
MLLLWSLVLPWRSGEAAPKMDLRLEGDTVLGMFLWVLRNEVGEGTAALLAGLLLRDG